MQEYHPGYKQEIRELLESRPGEWMSESEIAVILSYPISTIQYAVMRMHDVREEYRDGILYCKLME